jgi:hypothetical protein
VTEQESLNHQTIREIRNAEDAWKIYRGFAGQVDAARRRETEAMNVLNDAKKALEEFQALQRAAWQRLLETTGENKR